MNLPAILDPDTAWEIMQLLDQINRRGTTIVMVTHAKDIVDRMGKRVIAIDKGKIVRDDRGGAYGVYEEEDPLTALLRGEEVCSTHMIIRGIGHAIKQACKQIFRNRAMTFASFFSITAMLLILGMFFICCCQRQYGRRKRQEAV